MKPMTETRTIEIEFPIDAPVDAVWRALTDPEELTKWFPLDARVEPGPGGSVQLAWGPDLQGKSRIKIWEPTRRLQTSWFEPTEAFGSVPQVEHGPVAEAGARMLVDYILESDGGRTILRMVHSGFGSDARWDDEYDAHARGWRFELRSLRHYLERHLGRRRQVAWVRRTLGVVPPAEAWSRLLRPTALLAGGALDGVAAGDRYRIRTAHGQDLEGECVIHQPPSEFAGTVENLGDALFRCGVETTCGPPYVHVWLSTWDDSSRAGEFRTRWEATLAELFPS